MKIIALVGDRDRVELEAERLWRTRSTVLLPVDILVRRAAMELHGLTEGETYSSGPHFIERLGTTSQVLFDQIAGAVGRPAIHRRLSELIEIVRPSDDTLALFRLIDEDAEFVRAMGADVVLA